MAFVDELLERPGRSGYIRAEYPIGEVKAPHTCQHCRRIILNYEELKGWDQEPGVMIPLPHTLKEARAAAADGCPLFQQLARESRYPVSLQEFRYMLKQCFTKSPQDPKQSDEARLPELRQNPNLKYSFDIALAIPFPLYTFDTDQSLRQWRTRFKLLRYLLRHLRKRHLYLTFSHGRLRLYWLMRNEKSVQVVGEQVYFNPVFIYTMATNRSKMS